MVFSLVRQIKAQLICAQMCEAYEGPIDLLFMTFGSSLMFLDYTDLQKGEQHQTLLLEEVLVRMRLVTKIQSMVPIY